VLSGQVVPLMARDLAGLAADADGGVGEEAYRFGHGSDSLGTKLAQRIVYSAQIK
jgi:hypothetical protein